MKVSLIMPTYNKLPRLKLTMASIQMQNYPEDYYEVIIVDDGSTDNTEDYVKTFQVKFSLKYIRTQNGGRAMARNIGISHAKNELLIFIDDDVILNPNFIEEHVKRQQMNTGVVHGQIVNLSHLKFFEDPTNGILYSYFRSNIRKNTNLAMKNRCISVEDITHRFNEVFGRNNRLTSVEKMIQKVLTEGYTSLAWIGFTGGNVSVPKVLLEVEGGFDVKFGLKWGCEDLELGYRLHIKGHSFVYSEEAVNYHIAHFRQNFEQEHSETISYFYNKHKDELILGLHNFITGQLTTEDILSLLKQARD